MFRIVTIDGDYEQLIDDHNNVIAEAHHLDIEDVLHALGIKYECEEIWTDEI